MDSIALRTLAVRGKRSLICLVNIESYIQMITLLKVKIRRGIVKKWN